MTKVLGVYARELSERLSELTRSSLATPKQLCLAGDCRSGELSLYRRGLREPLAGTYIAWCRNLPAEAALHLAALCGVSMATPGDLADDAFNSLFCDALEQLQRLGRQRPGTPPDGRGMHEMLTNLMGLLGRVQGMIALVDRWRLQSLGRRRACSIPPAVRTPPGSTREAGG